MLETLDYTIRIGSTPTFLYFDLYLYSAYAAHFVYQQCCLQPWKQCSLIQHCSVVIAVITSVNKLWKHGSQQKRTCFFYQYKFSLGRQTAMNEQMKVRVMCRKFECRKDIHYKTQTGTSCMRKIQLQDLPTGNRTRALWITRPVLYHWDTEAVADNLGASSVYIWTALLAGSSLLNHIVETRMNSPILEVFYKSNSFFSPLK